MNRTARNRLLLCLALFHLFADVAYASGAILCIGPNEHREVESEHLAKLGCQPVGAPEVRTELASSGPFSSQNDCSDSPLHSEAELVSSNDQGSDAAPTPLVSFTSLEPLTTTAAVIRPRARAPAVNSAIRAHRTTVLLI